MSKSPGKYSNSGTREIPTRRVLINDPSQLPFDYSTTPGGTIFSTTPGGTEAEFYIVFIIFCGCSHLSYFPVTQIRSIKILFYPILRIVFELGEMPTE